MGAKRGAGALKFDLLSRWSQTLKSMPLSSGMLVFEGWTCQNGASGACFARVVPQAASWVVKWVPGGWVCEPPPLPPVQGATLHHLSVWGLRAQMFQNW